MAARRWVSSLHLEHPGRFPGDPFDLCLDLRPQIQGSSNPKPEAHDVRQMSPIHMWHTVLEQKRYLSDTDHQASPMSEHFTSAVNRNPDRYCANEVRSTGDAEKSNVVGVCDTSLANEYTLVRESHPSHYGASQGRQ